MWQALYKHDRNLINGLLLALQKVGLATYQGDPLTFLPGLLNQNPSDDVLEKVARFRRAAALPSLRGRIRGGRTRPPYFTILLEYYRALWEERAQARVGKSRGEESAHERARLAAAKKVGYTPAAFKKHLEEAQKLNPDLTRLWKRKGSEWIRSS